MRPNFRPVGVTGTIAVWQQEKDWLTHLRGGPHFSSKHRTSALLSGSHIQGPCIYLDPRRVTPFSLDWLVADCNTLGGGRTGYWKLTPDVVRPGRYSFYSGELKVGGIAYVYVWLARSYDPPEGHPGQQAYTLVILDPIDISQLSINFLCLLRSRYVSLWSHD